MSDQASSAFSTTRRMVFWLAVMILAAGVAIALVIPPSYEGRCSVTTEFTCGYRPRTGFKWLVALVSISFGVPLLIWAKGRMTRQIGFWIMVGVVVSFAALGVFMIFATNNPLRGLLTGYGAAGG